MRYLWHATTSMLQRFRSPAVLRGVGALDDEMHGHRLAMFGQLPGGHWIVCK